MLTRTLPTRPLRSSSFSSCICQPSQRQQRRHAHPAPASVTSHAAPPPPLPSSSPTSISPKDGHPAWSDPAYHARYRDPTNHDRRRGTPSSAAASSSSRYATTSTSTAARKPSSSSNGSTPRSRRLEMERLWSGGEASPPIPLTSHRSPLSHLQPHAVLLPGSGSQYVGMGAFLREYPTAKLVWQEAEEALNGFESWREGLGLEELEGEVGVLGRMLRDTKEERGREKTLQQVVFDGPQDELTRSSNAQPAILITSTAFLRTLENDFNTPIASHASAILGHSSGEYSAAVATGAISFADGVRLTRLHGLLTSHALSLPSIGLSPSPSAAASVRGQMSALVINPGHSHAEVTQIIKRIRGDRSKFKGSEGTVEVASFNSSAQLVLAGSREGILRASEELRELGIASRAADLPVSAPFHCSFMQPAADGMRIALSSVKLRDPNVPLVSCLDGSFITTSTSLTDNLVSQISLPVRWSVSLANLRQNGIHRLLFCGPGQALANLARRDSQGQEETEVLAVATQEDMEGIKELWEAEREGEEEED